MNKISPRNAKKNSKSHQKITEYRRNSPMKLCDVITPLTEKRTETKIRSFPLSISTNHNTARKNSFPLTRDEPERKRKIDQ